MNGIHRWMCGSAYWQKLLESQILPWVLGGVELGRELLEIGPGPGLTTDLLRTRVAQLTALEIDPVLADSLAARLAGSNVLVVHGDATKMPFEDARFSGVVSFTMLHHLPSPEMQDRLLREVRRVLRPGGVFAGVDSRQSLRMRLLHIRDTLVPVDPRTFAARLQAAGFVQAGVETNDRAFRFHAQRKQVNHQGEFDAGIKQADGFCADQGCEAGENFL